MSYGAERWAREKCLDFKGDQTSLAVLKEIAFWFLDDEMICKDISQGDITKLLGLKRQQTVSDALKRLAEKGLVISKKIIDTETGSISGTHFFLPQYVPEEWPATRQGKQVFLRKKLGKCSTEEVGKTDPCGQTDLCGLTAEGMRFNRIRVCGSTAEGYAVKPQTYTGNKQGYTGNDLVVSDSPIFLNQKTPSCGKTPLPKTAGVSEVEGGSEVKGGVKVHPRVEVPENPVQFCTPTPCKSAPLREHIKEHEENNQSEDDSPFFLTPETPAANHADETLKTDDKPAQTQVSHPADAPAAKTKRKAITHELDLDALPDNWRAICEELRPDLDPEKVFAEFRFYWQQGRGQGTRRSDKGWTSTWLNWIKRQKEQRAPKFSAPADLPPALNPRQLFDDDYYAGCNNDELARVLAREEEMKNANR